MILLPHSYSPRRGVVLVAVLVVVVLLSLAAYQYNELMLAEYKASHYSLQAAQVRALADSGVHYAAALLGNPDNFTDLLNSNPFNNEERFGNIPVTGNESSGLPGRFSIIAPLDPNDAGSGGLFRHGVQDEAGKINPNALMKLDPSGQKLYNMLMKLPNMTDDVASSIIVWLDPKNQPRNNAADNSYYSGLSPAYRCKNGSLDSIEELLLVRGVPEFLFGTDKNRNGIQDAGEDSSGAFDRGWSAFLTTHSREQNVDARGNALVYVNGKEDVQTLYDKLALPLGEDLAKFIILYRQYGPSNTSSSTQALLSYSTTTPYQTVYAALSELQTLTFTLAQGKQSSSSAAKTVPGSLADLTVESLTKKKMSKNITSFFDLLTSTVTIPGADPKKDPSVVYTSPLSDTSQQQELLPKLFVTATTFDGTEIPARINVNTAPREVLVALFTEADADQILATRPKASSGQPPEEIDQTPAWLLLKAKLKAETLKPLEKYITTRTQVYRVQVVGFFDTPGPSPSARVEAVIDTNSGRPRILSWRDLSELGKGMEVTTK